MLVGRLQPLLNLFHVAILCIIRFEKVSQHIGHSETEECSQIAIVDCSQECGFCWKTQGGMVIANHMPCLGEIVHIVDTV